MALIAIGVTCVFAAGGRGTDDRVALSPRGAYVATDERLGEANPWNSVHYDVSCETADYRQVHDKTKMSDDDRALLRRVTYVSGFWRLRSGHRDPQKYIDGLKETPCEAAGFALNVVFVEDSEKMCTYMLKLYREGAKDQGNYTYGAGKATCVVLDPNSWGINPTKCNGEFSHIWYNKVNIVHEVAKKIEAGEISEDFKATHYFWMDGDIAHGIVGKIGRFPRLEPVLRVLKDEGREDKMMVRCYASDTLDSWSYAATGSQAALGLPASKPNYCPWMRHEVIANIFGGSLSALDSFVKAWPEYINKHVPTEANGGDPRSGDEVCDCPSEEFLMTSMANDQSYMRYYSKNTCARNLREPL